MTPKEMQFNLFLVSALCKAILGDGDSSREDLYEASILIEGKEMEAETALEEVGVLVLDEVVSQEYDEDEDDLDEDDDLGPDDDDDDDLEDDEEDEDYDVELELDLDFE